MHINDITNYDLGIIWALGSNSESNRFSFRHKERYFLERLSLYFSNTIYKQIRSKNKDDLQYVMKVSRIEKQQLYDIGWSERNADIRDIPILADYKDFLRAYMELHSRLDYSTRHRRDKTKYKALRLRIYGNVILINSINKLLNENAKVGIKSLEVLNNEKTAILNYASFTEIESIFNYLDGDPHFDTFWNDIYFKLKHPIKEYK